MYPLNEYLKNNIIEQEWPTSKNHIKSLRISDARSDLRFVIISDKKILQQLYRVDVEFDRRIWLYGNDVMNDWHDVWLDVPCFIEE